MCLVEQLTKLRLSQFLKKVKQKMGQGSLSEKDTLDDKMTEVDSNIFQPRVP